MAAVIPTTEVLLVDWLPKTATTSDLRESGKRCTRASDVGTYRARASLTTIQSVPFDLPGTLCWSGRWVGRPVQRRRRGSSPWRCGEGWSVLVVDLCTR